MKVVGQVWQCARAIAQSGVAEALREHSKESCSECDAGGKMDTCGFRSSSEANNADSGLVGLLPAVVRLFNWRERSAVTGLGAMRRG